MIENVNERMKCAYQLLLTTNPSQRGNMLYTLYDRVIENDFDLLKEIIDNKLSDKKSDIEIDEIIKRTLLFELEKNQENEMELTREELEELRKKYIEVKDAIDIVRVQGRHHILLNE